MRNQCIIFITPNWRTWFETTLVKWSSLCWTFNLDRQCTSSWDKSSNTKGEKASPWEWKPAPLSSKISSLFIWCCWPFWRRAESFLAGQRSLRPYLPPRGKREKLHCTCPILCENYQLRNVHPLPHGAGRGKLERCQSVFMENLPSCKPDKWDSVSFSHVRHFVAPWTTACLAPLSVGFSRQEYWIGLPFAPPGDLPDRGIKPGSPGLKAESFPSEPPGKPIVSKEIAKYFVLSKGMYKWDPILRSV